MAIEENPQFSNLDIFISHSSTDKEIAEVLVDLLRAALNIPADKIRCTSVNGYRLPGGASTQEQLRREVHDATVLIGILTQRSAQSAYVLFELGARWGAGRHLLPLLASGADANLLRAPLSSFNALHCDEPAQIYQLVSDVASLLEKNPNNPSAYQKFVEALVRISTVQHTSDEVSETGVSEAPVSNESLNDSDRLSHLADPDNNQIMQFKQKLALSAFIIISVVLLLGFVAWLEDPFNWFNSDTLTKSDFVSLGILPTERKIYDIAMNHDASVIASTGREEKVRLWQLVDLSLLKELTGYTQFARSIAFSRDGQVIATGNDDGLIRLWQVGDGKVIKTLKGHTSQVSIVAFNPDGNTLMSAGEDKTIRLWNVREGSSKTIKTLDPDERVVCISFDQDTIVLYDSVKKEIKLWSVSDNRVSTTLKRNENDKSDVKCGAFSLDGRFFALGYDNGSIDLRRVIDGWRITWVTSESEPGSVAFSPDDQVFAAGWADGVVKLWKGWNRSDLWLDSRNPWKSLQGHTSMVRKVAFSESGIILATASDDTTVRLWKLTEVK